MCAVHASQGPLEPASPHLRSEVDIVCSLAEATLGGPPRLPWADFRADYTAIRRPIARVVPGCDGVRREGRPARRLRAAAPAARHPHVPDRRRAGRSSRSARSTCSTCPRAGCCCRRCAPTTSSTPRSTGSTTATAASRAAAGWCSCTPTTSPRLGFADGDLVDLVSEWSDGVGADRRRVPGRGLRPAARLRRGVLPGDQPAGPARLHGRGQQQPDLEVGGRPARARRRPAQRRHRATPAPSPRAAAASARSSRPPGGATMGR